MKTIQLKKGNTKTNSRDLYWQKSSVWDVSLDNRLGTLIIVTSYEYITGNLHLIPDKQFDEIDSWLSEKTNQLFEEYKLNQNKFPKDMIIIQFPDNAIPDLANFVENEA